MLYSNIKEYEKNRVPSFYDKLDDKQKSSINAFIDGLIEEAYNRGTPFKVSDLVGKNIFPLGWSNTPLDLIYKYNVEAHSERGAFQQSGIDVGILIKNRLSVSPYLFLVHKKFGNEYVPVCLK